MIDEMVDVRSKVMRYLKLELLGPRGGENEELTEEPYRRYTAGTLYPPAAPSDPVIEEEEEDEVGVSGGDFRGGLQENQADDPVVSANQYLPGSMGLSFYLRGEEPSVAVRVQAARYLEDTGEGHGRHQKTVWKRVPVSAPEGSGYLELIPDVGRSTTERGILAGAARIHAVWRKGRDGWLVTVTVVNAKENQSGGLPGADDCLFQVELSCRPAGSSRVAAYPRSRLTTDDLEEHILDVLYRHQVAYGVGHGCSVTWDEPANGATTEIRTEFLPTCEVPAMDYSLQGYERVLDIHFLAYGDSETGYRLIDELDRFIAGYETWIESLDKYHDDVPEDLLEARDELLSRLRRALYRMESGVRLLENDRTVRRAFCMANQAMLMQMAHSAEEYAGSRRRAGEHTYKEPPPSTEGLRRWRPFQLAFQLLTVASVASPEDPYREVVDLIWFPTGGGKTEAYLAMAAFQIFHRRMVHGSFASGTAVLMRYTLRLLTTQQFQRAATLICACELLRQEDPGRLGEEEISIGLWVGQDTTPNTYQQARKKTDELREQEEPRNPFQIDRCPWCGTELVPDSWSEESERYGVRSTNSGFSLFCPGPDCPFHERLPVGVVDEQLYDHPPTLLLATVDKFARLPREKRIGEFFGGADRLPPDLVIQDELHLISGPLGTIVGIYETAIDALASWQGVMPKILASTATIRRADEQCKGLFARRVELFPPSGLDATDSYFARQDRSRPGRLYLGVMAPGHTASTSMIRTSAALLQAPIDLGLEGEALDAYWTLVGYHNSLRELGKSRTFGADDIPARIKVIADDQDNIRQLSDDNVQELTSNIPAAQLGDMLDRMSRRMGEDGALSLVLCTNMLSVGVDVQRLGVMLVNGQPKSTSEYIQSTSRVGRGRVPGLIVTVYSPSKPRDRSHYERFVAYHSSLYRQVEPTSVTPFARPARDRALHAVLVSLVRHALGLSEQSDAGEFDPDLAGLDRVQALLEQRIRQIDPREVEPALRQLQELVQEWGTRASQLEGLNYTTQTRAKQALLLNPGEKEQEGWETLHSMRNVDRSCLIRIVGA